MTDADTIAGQHTIAALPPVNEVVRELEWLAGFLAGESEYDDHPIDDRDRLHRAASMMCSLAVAYPALVRDTERLDWLEDRIVDGCGRPVHLVRDKDESMVRIETWGTAELREVVDAAMAARVTPEREAERPEGAT